jgi:hypothetical protein
MTVTSRPVDQAKTFAGQPVSMLMLIGVLAWLACLLVAVAFCRAAAVGDIRTDG